MTRTIRRLSFVASLLAAPAFVGLVAPVATAQAAETGDSATAYLKTKQNGLTKILKDNKPGPARTQKVNAELDTLIDYDEMARASLGDEWGKRSEGERKQFTELLKQLIQKNYTKRMDDLVEYDIAYKSEQPTGGDTTVKTEAKSQKDKRAAPVLVDYVLRKKGSSYVIVDIIPEGSSYVRTYNKEFTKILKKPVPDGGWDALVAKMKKKLAEP
jgi:phospholipid transport system substrate-binding protein